ncbi:MAG: type I-C CRISPR-associated protein Cas8c/Csd1 [Haemophilus parainfluenzae]|jgi:CRISPR-associated protein, csd1 family|uniref:type I-C CRISPR-associated protein Cas8c/Csd1 n=1 Tax=uncultured Haemophilus sp. TaxID=237779 RepID=UPI002803F2AC|nr:type I-C CRISPR-associated protein Cas8c/Csd1 [uncultured Haemophilus sp.]MBS5085460.1 type I-C CRISPR-associated protein Cas8c/Csd1 [Haemophilus parainfluenzae]MDU1945634.1 type I-C CRISPR-associated protein Cas8c/Csd1 [Haemophilus parainfluenzae]MDU2038585.1 type I-C CRISPR-associated protein Cas8c/Csd1 [Haemophilus parainfluenzae]MDU6289044.1 type I-C CRISPR-associated protein Cas8c/Csd1 [Haemophilus parainfluenzae]
MILHALTQYYQRKAESDDGVAPEGFENKEIPFIIVIDKQGKFIQLEDTRELKNKKKVARTFLVPKGLGRSGSKSYEVSNLLWDHYGYVLAYAGEKGQEQADKQHASFTANVNELKQALPDDAGVAAVAAFLASAEEKSKVMQAANWAECAKVKGCNLSFRLVDETVDLVCQSKAVQAYVSQANQAQSDNIPKGICLVTGKLAPIARLHNPVKGVNAKPTPFTSVNLSAFESYGKEQGFIFPVGEQVMFEYTTALNTLLAGENRFRIGDVTAICWSAKPTPLEEYLASLISGGGKDNPDAHIDAVKSLYKSLYNGKYTEPDGKEKFYLLGLSPNSARIVVRFWHETTVAALSESIAAWYDDLQMVRGENSPYPEYMPLPRLLGNLVLDGKMENLPSDLIAQITDAALNNRVLPVSLLQAALRRNKAEQKITYGRASLLKAYINRAIRAGRLKNMEELTMSLDRNRQDIGYVLGRLFAVLEKTQAEANPGLNATIADRYFGSASSTPIAVFGTLMRLLPHHLNKLEFEGRAVQLQWEIRQILEHCQKFPNHLNLEQQGLFAIGYYHETQFLFTKDALKNLFNEAKTA